MSFDINKAARIMRTGDEFSGTNKKLRNAVNSFIKWMFEALEGYALPGEEIGWIFEKEDENSQQIKVSFEKGGWHYVTTNSKETQMYSIVLFCKALVGSEGEKLLAWLKENTQERIQLLTALESIQSFRSSTIEQNPSE